MRTREQSPELLRWMVEQYSPSHHEQAFSRALAGRLAAGADEAVQIGPLDAAEQRQGQRAPAGGRRADVELDAVEDFLDPAIRRAMPSPPSTYRTLGNATRSSSPSSGK